MPPKKVTAKKPKTPPEEEHSEWESAQTIYEFSAKTITGEEISLEKYRGCVCIIVNVASNCVHTKLHYTQLVELHKKFATSHGLKILAFPCNQFGSQEPGNAEKIQRFLKVHRVKFIVFEKVKVNGKAAHPLFKFLKEKLPGPNGKNIKWNFTKFIIDEEGVPVVRYRTGVEPLDLIYPLVRMWLTAMHNAERANKSEPDDV